MGERNLRRVLVKILMAMCVLCIRARSVRVSNVDSQCIYLLDCSTLQMIYFPNITPKINITKLTSIIFLSSLRF